VMALKVRLMSSLLTSVPPANSGASVTRCDLVDPLCRQCLVSKLSLAICINLANTGALFARAYQRAIALHVTAGDNRLRDFIASILRVGIVARR
jgi:hypothetical protein